MSERYSNGVEWTATTGPAVLYFKTPDGKIHRFTDAHEAIHFHLEGLSCATRHFTVPLVNPDVLRPDDRQKR